MQKALRVAWRCHTHLTREDLRLMLRDRYAPVDLFALVPALELRFEFSTGAARVPLRASPPGCATWTALRSACRPGSTCSPPPPAQARRPWLARSHCTSPSSTA